MYFFSSFCRRTSAERGEAADAHFFFCSFFAFVFQDILTHMQSVKTLQTLNALVLFRCQLCDEGVRFLAEVIGYVLYVSVFSI